MDQDDTIAINLPKKLIAEWKFLVQTRQQAEGGEEVDPVEVLRQAIATETYLWQQKALENRRTRAGRVAGKGLLW
ncbi:MAG: hypothetical protein HC866_10410 [Leptolyngbyaceae cyanobacterium RU_5_1]|nr:hypothetical protein [Leptolyngbyaceae cyanobacterium RU_5_1]